MTRLLLPLLLTAGCAPLVPKPDSATPVWNSEAPSIVALSLTCDPAVGQWSFQLETTGWTGITRLWMGPNAALMEQSDFTSDVAAANGDWDCVGGTVPMAADVANPGSATRWRCDDLPALYGLVAVSDAEGNAWTDCRVWGPDENTPWESISGAPSCDARVAWEPETPATIADGQWAACATD